MQAPRPRIGQYVVDQIGFQDVVSGVTLYYVRWYGYNAKTIFPSQQINSPTILFKPSSVVKVVGNARLDNKLRNIIKKERGKAG